MDVDAGIISYSFNGSLAPPAGVAFKGHDAARVRMGVSPAVSLRTDFACEVNLGPGAPGGRPFAFAEAAAGYQPVSAAVALLGKRHEG